MVDVPTRDSATSALKDGGMTGGSAVLGEVIGRSILGPGVGTAAGGIVTASMLDGTSREIAASLAVERGANEIATTAMGGGSSSGNGGVM